VSRDGEVLSRYDPEPAGLPGLGTPRFSPDGSRIYAIGTEEDGSRGVFWVPAAGGRATKVVAWDDPSLNTSFPVVGPEHLYLVVSKTESDIWVMDLEW